MMEFKMFPITAIALVTCAILGHVGASRPMEGISGLAHKFEAQEAQVRELRQTITDLTRQVMLQQYFVEEKIRGDGNSGVKKIRGGSKGLNNYDSNSHSSNSFIAIHDHSNYDRTIGMGEFSLVLNGLEFRTRHNDYKLVMPDPDSDEYDAVKNIEFPPVPPEVLALPPEKQIDEMREWFYAYWTQNTTHRNYTSYFRPVIAYLEGGWTLDKTLVESFSSDRHKLAASSWFELQSKNRFAAYSGSKDRFENLAYLPTTIMDVNKTTGEATYAQWNYRILCYPIKRDIPFELLQPVEDMSIRTSRGWTRAETQERRAARFKLYEGSNQHDYSILDEIMYTIPGKDNRYTDLTQAMFGNGTMYDFARPLENIKLDTSRYHRWYKSAEKDAMGLTAAARCFNDDNCFVAQTNQPRVAPLSFHECGRASKTNRTKVCVTSENRFTYALPLEIIFLTPLSSWNPYNLTIYEGLDVVDDDGKLDGSHKRPYKGVDSNNYYLTPVEFFKGQRGAGSPADTVRNSVVVRGPDGNRYTTSASGVQIMLQDIDKVGRVRTRFPIAPVHGEGSSVWKELNALRDMVTGGDEGPPKAVSFEMANNGDHTHEFTISYNDFLKLVNDNLEVSVWTQEADSHRHYITFKHSRWNKGFYYTSCDGEPKCFDGHEKDISKTTNNVYTQLR